MPLYRGIILVNRNSGSMPKQDIIQETLPFLKLYVLFFFFSFLMTLHCLSLTLDMKLSGFIWIGAEQQRANF